MARHLAGLCMPHEAWPAHDQRAWTAAISPAGPFDAGGTRSANRERSNEKTAKGYGRWLRWLANHDTAALQCHFAGRVTSERVERYAAALQAAGNSPSTVANRVRELYDAMRAMEPGDWSWLRRAAGMLKARARPVRDKASCVVSVVALVELGDRLMASHHAAGAPVRQAAAFRDGMMIGLLALMPLRRGNLLALSIGSTLKRLPDDTGWIVSLHGSMTKTGRPIEAHWPAHLRGALDEWLAVHRPRMIRRSGRWHSAAGDALWVSADGSPLSEIAAYDMIRKRTRAAFGHAVNPHLFRDCAATTLAVELPASIRLITPLLGHSNPATAERHYNQAAMTQSVRRYIEGVQEVRSTRSGSVSRTTDKESKP